MLYMMYLIQSLYEASVTFEGCLDHHLVLVVHFEECMYVQLRVLHVRKIAVATEIKNIFSAFCYLTTH